MRKVRVSQKASSDIEEALVYVLERFGAEIALRVEHDILAALKLIERYPTGGQLEPWLVHLGLGHRRVVVGPLKIIYRIEGNIVFVLRVFNARQSPERMQE